MLFVTATQLKPDEGTPDLPEGRARVRLETDGSVHDVTEFEIEKVRFHNDIFLIDLNALCIPLSCNVRLIPHEPLNLPFSGEHFCGDKSVKRIVEMQVITRQPFVEKLSCLDEARLYPAPALDCNYLFIVKCEIGQTDQ